MAETGKQTGTMYISDTGRKYKVMAGIGDTPTFKARFQRAEKSGGVGWKGVNQLPWRPTFAEAQADLDRLAAKHGWSVWEGGSE